MTSGKIPTTEAPNSWENKMQRNMGVGIKLIICLLILKIGLINYRNEINLNNGYVKLRFKFISE